MASPPRPAEIDPLGWTALLAAAFLALVWHRLGTPSQIYFDEIHYVIAARKLLALQFHNPEHPLYAKEVIAAAIALFGDRPLVWRAPSALMGALGLFAFGRMLWFSSQSRFAALSGMVLLATGFHWFVQSRIAMLDMVMAALLLVAAWMLAAALRDPAGARWRLALAGTCMGLSLAAKWAGAPLLVLPGLVFLVLKARDCGWRFAFSRERGPVAGITLIEAPIGPGRGPLAPYWATFAPAFFYVDRPVVWWDVIGQHRYMLELQDSVTKPHPYRSVWYQWIGNWRAIWYLYEHVDGAQRGVLLVGNPFTMLAGLPAVLWCLWAGLRQANRAALAFSLAYPLLIAFWALTSKPVQFYYHSLLPSV
ncbi:MAG TPA: phospholipid carrier-dependent glycosyltransferase, partial [Novosphingobium sp.]|nr:phospholipid carrier-dependent glycosyltransferase [Novosphingobium sp.]